jgi:hypothetical protein
MDKTDAEALAELLGDPLPADWRDHLARQARRDHLAALAYATADATTEVLRRTVELGGKCPAGDPISEAFLDNLLALERGWRRFVHDTDSEAGPIVAEALEFAGGKYVRRFVEAALETLREVKRQGVKAKAAELEARTVQAAG